MSLLFVVYKVIARHTFIPCCWSLSYKSHTLVKLCMRILVAFGKFVSSKTPSPSLSGTAGWSVDCLQEWGPFLRLAIPSMLMNCLEWWLYEIAGFLAGIVGEVELGAQSVVYQLAAVAYMVPAFLLHSGGFFFCFVCFDMVIRQNPI